jgi:type II secretory pathway component PulM
MFRNMAPRERFLIFASAAVIGLVLVWSFVIVPALERQRHAAEMVPERKQVLERRRELIARKTAIAAEAAETDAKIEKLSERFLTAAVPAVAASELQKLTKEMVAQAGTETRSERILPPVENGEILVIPVEIAVSGEIRQLVDLLARLEQSPKLLTVQDLKIRVVNINQPKDLLATIIVQGYVMPGKAKA